MIKEEILKTITEWSNEELAEFKNDIDRLIKNNSEVVEITLYYNKYKGSGKAWVANIDSHSKKILSFVEPENTIKDGYKGEKLFYLKDGFYLTCEAGSSTRDFKQYIEIKNGEIIEMD